MKKIYILLAALCCAMTVLATNVGDTITYAYQGNTLWYKVSSSYCSLVPPCKTSTDGHYWGTNTQPSGVVYVPDSVPVDGVMTPVTYCNDYVFYGLKNVTEVHLNNRISTISRLFNGCSIETLYLGQSLDNLGYGSLSEAASLERVVMAYPDQVLSVAWNTFIGVKMYNAAPNGYFCLGKNAYTYKGDVVDSTLTLPDTTLNMGDFFGYLMYNKATAVRDLELPATITNLGIYATFGMTKLKKVTCHATTPPSVQGRTFLSSDNSYTQIDLRNNAILYVPYSEDHSVLAAYQAHAVWGLFSRVVEIGTEVQLYDLPIVVVNGHLGNVTVNDMSVTNGRRLSMEGGESVTVKATPTTGRLIDYVKWDDAVIADTTGLSGAGLVVDASMSADHTLTVAFKKDPEVVLTGDTVPYYYMGDTLWYVWHAYQAHLVVPCKQMTNNHYYGTHTLPSGVVYIPDSIEVGGVKKAVLSSGEYIFQGLTGVTEVYMNSLMRTCSRTFESSGVKVIHLGAAFGYFDYRALALTDSLQRVELADPNQIITNSWSSFQHCPLYTQTFNDFFCIGRNTYTYNGEVADSTITLPDTTLNMGDYFGFLMGRPEQVRNLVLPVCLTNVGMYTLFYMVNVKTVTCYAPVPPTTSTRSFHSHDNTSTQIDLRTQATLYVPWSEDHSILAAYQAHAEWGQFHQIVELPEPTATAIETVGADALGAEKLLLNGRIIIRLADGTMYDAAGRRL